MGKYLPSLYSRQYKDKNIYWQLQALSDFAESLSTPLKVIQAKNKYTHNQHFSLMMNEK